jgi:hypothetical protein
MPGCSWTDALTRHSQLLTPKWYAVLVEASRIVVLLVGPSG